MALSYILDVYFPVLKHTLNISLTVTFSDCNPSSIGKYLGRSQLRHYLFIPYSLISESILVLTSSYIVDTA